VNSLEAQIQTRSAENTVFPSIIYSTISEKVYHRLTGTTQWPTNLWKHFKSLQEHRRCDHQKSRKSCEANWGCEYM